MECAQSGRGLSGSHADDAGAVHGYIRSIDVAEHLGVTKPSVTYATKQLKQNGFITMDRDGLITLTESGMEIATGSYPAQDADGVFHAHRRVDEKTAREDACKVEHDVSEKTLRPSAPMRPDRSLCNTERSRIA